MRPWCNEWGCIPNRANRPSRRRNPDSRGVGEFPPAPEMLIVRGVYPQRGPNSRRQRVQGTGPERADHRFCQNAVSGREYLRAVEYENEISRAAFWLKEDQTLRQRSVFESAHWCSLWNDGRYLWCRCPEPQVRKGARPR